MSVHNDALLPNWLSVDHKICFKRGSMLYDWFEVLFFITDDAGQSENIFKFLQSPCRHVDICALYDFLRSITAMNQEQLGTAALVFVILQFIHPSITHSSSLRDGYDGSRKQFIYALRQQDLMEMEKKFERRDYHLNLKEHVVDNYLQYLKWQVLQTTASTGDFPPTRPIEEVLDDIKSSEIYKVLKIMPKGGILHTHENHQLGKVKLLELFLSSNISDQLYVHHGPHSTHEWKFEVHKEDPDRPGLINVLRNSHDPTFSVENLAKHQTMIGSMETSPAMSPSDSSKRWKLANKVFGRGSSSLVVDSEMKKKYLRAMYEQGLSEGIYYFETRKSFSRLERDIHLTKGLVEEFKQDHPEFVGHRRIYYSKRTDPHEIVEKNLDDLSRVIKLHPDHVLGYDIVGDEDWGSTNLHFINEFLKYIDVSPSGEIKSSIPWLFHTAESNWVENFYIPSINNPDDVVPRSNNLYSALLLGAKRIGHGIGFWKHPYLMQLLKKMDIPLEVCVVSNQLLGYSHDLRQHPAQLFHKMGIPIILSPDDPGLFGYDEVTLDWYEAFMGWVGLNLGDLRQFGINSIKYSGMDEEEKQQVIEGVLEKEWNEYIDIVFDKACEEKYDKGEVKFEKIFPLHGSRVQVTIIHILGFHFEHALCRKIFCRFGNESSRMITEGRYVSIQHLLCKTPSVELLEREETNMFPIHITWSADTHNHHHHHHHDENHSTKDQNIPILRPWMETGFQFQFHEYQVHSTTSCASCLMRMSALVSIFLLYLF